MFLGVPGVPVPLITIANCDPLTSVTEVGVVSAFTVSVASVRLAMVVVAELESALESVSEAESALLSVDEAAEELLLSELLS